MGRYRSLTTSPVRIRSPSDKPLKAPTVASRPWATKVNVTTSVRSNDPIRPRAGPAR